MDWLKIVVASLMRQIEKLNKKKADRSEIAKPDWTVNDPNDPRYIEGRTHYVVETNDRAILKDVTVESEWNGMVDSYGALVSSTFYDYYFDETTKYVVIWDGVEYRDVMSRFGATSSGYGGPYYNDGSGYVFWFVQDGEYLNVKCSEGTHTFSIFEQGVKSREYVTIPEEYLPAPVGKAGAGEHAEVFNGNDSEAATGAYSHAEGFRVTASGDYCHVEGRNTTASGIYSHAEGYYAVASGACSHAEGSGTNATGDGSHAEGASTEASASYSHAEGDYTVASGIYSHAEGQHTIAAGRCQHVQGKYNASDATGKYAHIVGNGTNNSVTGRSNAHTLDWNGLGWFKGGLKVGGFHQDDPNAVSVALKTDIPSKVSSFTNDAGYAKTTDVIPVPATASPGQTIVVKTVDESGKPSSWEAKDMSGMIVTIRNPGADNASCDKTSIEIAEAAKKGIPVIGHIIEADDSGVEQMRIANFAGLWDNGTPETVGAFFYDMKLANGYNAWNSNLSVRVLTVTPEGAVSYTGGSSFAAQTE